LDPDNTLIFSLAAICWLIYLLVSTVDGQWDKIILNNPKLNQRPYSLKTQNGRSIAKLIFSVLFISLLASTNDISPYWVASVTLSSVVALTVGQNIGKLVGSYSIKASELAPIIVLPLPVVI